VLVFLTRKPPHEKSIAQKFEKLKETHAEIMANLDMVKSASATVLAEQEEDLLRAFRARLFDVQTELDRDQSKKVTSHHCGDNPHAIKVDAFPPVFEDESATAWIIKAQQLEAEVDWASKIATQLEEKTRSLNDENAGMKSRYFSGYKAYDSIPEIRSLRLPCFFAGPFRHALGEEEQDFLVKEVVAMKKEGAFLQAEAKHLEAECASLRAQKAEATFHFVAPTPSGFLPTLADADAAYEATRAKAHADIAQVLTPSPNP
jgi:hypothetical protein